MTTTQTPAPDDPVRFEGERYVYSGSEEDCPAGWVAFHRPPAFGKGDTKYKRVRCELRDLRWSAAHKAWILPGRGVLVADPNRPDRPGLFVEDAEPAAVADARIRNYLGLPASAPEE